jgi:gas vesicle protein
MYYEENSRAFNFIAGLALGAVVGAGLALVLAPKSGRRTRSMLKRAVSGVAEGAGERWDELSDDLRAGLSKSRRRPRT